MNWIDVRKQKPKAKQKVLAVGIDYRFKNLGMQFEVFEYLDGEWMKNDGELVNILYITHWIPLPSPLSND